MEDDARRPPAVLLVARTAPGPAGPWVRLGPLPAREGCGLELVDDLAQMSLALGRFGFCVRLVDVERRVRDLLVLAGLDELLCD